MHKVVISKRARRFLETAPVKLKDALLARILALSDNPRPPGVKKLTDQNTYRVRQGDYRISYEIDDAERIVTILAIRHRREAYRSQ